MSESKTEAGPTALPMGFTREPLPASHHVCLIYESEEERRRVVSQYLATGIAHHDLIRYFADVTAPGEVRAWLQEAGADVEGAEQGGGFSVIPAQEAYCPSGTFDPNAVIGRLLQRYVTAEKAGFAASRVAAEMTWALRGLPGSERLLEYEALLNTIDSTFPHVGMCQYDTRRFDGATLHKVLQVHPFVVAQGQIVRNPNYVRPEEFLAGLPR